MRLSAVLFDLDGTLLYTLQDIADSMNTALAAHGMPTFALEQYRWFVGSGVREMVTNALPPDTETPTLVDSIIGRFRAEYEVHWGDTTRPYEGIAETLERLRSAGLRLAVLSNTPDSYTGIMVRHFFRNALFDVIQGQREPFAIKPDPASALHVLATLGLPPQLAAIVGDSDVDMFTARNAGITGVGVDWGYRPREELLGAGAAFIASTPVQLAGWLLPS